MKLPDTWTHFPIVNEDDLQLLPAILELYEGHDQRKKCLGQQFWPRQNSIQETIESFSVSGSGPYTLTASGKDWTLGGPPAGCAYGGTRWFDYTIDCPPQDNSNVIRFFDVIFDHDDHKKVVRAEITGNTAHTLTLTFSPSIQTLIAQGVISSLSSLSSRKAYIIKRGGVWHSERWPEHSNTQVLWRGVVDTYVHVCSIPSTSGSLKGKTLKRDGKPDVAITESGSDWIAIPYEATSPSGSFTVVDIDGTTVLHSGSLGSVSVGIYEQMDRYKFINTATPSRFVTWEANKWTGKQVLVRESDGHVHRITVSSNKSNIIIIPSQSFAPSGSYAIVTAGTFHVLDHSDFQPGIWYRGIRENLFTHKPDDRNWPDNLGIIKKAVEEVEFKDAQSFESCGPDEQWHTAFDTDVWSESTNVCSGWQGAEKNWSKDVYKTFRMLQVDVLATAWSFVPVKNYAGEKAIPLFVTARILYYCGINHFSSTTSRHHDTTTDEYNLVIGTFSSLPHSPIKAHYVVLDSYGDNWIQGETTLSNGVPVNLGGNHAADKAGLTVLWSFGLTRYVPREFRYWPEYKKTIFLPDWDETTDDLGIPTTAVYYPPEVADYCCDNQEEPPEECCRSCKGVGQYVTQDGSTTYLTRNKYGIVKEGSESPQVGDIARYVGDNHADVALGGTEQKELAPDASYMDRFYRGRHHPQLQIAYDLSKVGVAGSGTTMTLTDSEKNWFVDWYGDGEMRTEAGTATAGSSSHLIDSTRIPVDTGDGNPLACFWKLDRVDTNTGYKDFIIEIDKVSGTGPSAITTTYKTPITSVVPASARINFAPVAGLTVAAGDAFRVVEAGELHRWRNRDIELTYADGTKVTRKITHNDATTLWLDATVPLIEEGVVYRIIEPEYGTTWRWNGTKWVKPTGIDPRSGLPFRIDSRLNLPTYVKRYGFYEAGDELNKHVLNEIWKIIDAQRWTKYEAAWTSRVDPETEELNAWQPTQQLVDIGCYAIGGGADSVTWEGSGEIIYYDDDGNPVYDHGLLGCYTRATHFEADGSAPYWQASGTLFPTSSYIGGGAQYAYGIQSGIPTLLARAVDFYAMGYINSSNPDEEDEIESGCYERNEPWNNIYHSGERNVHSRVKWEDHLGLSFRTFTKYSSGTPNTDERVVSGQLGSASPVPPVDKPMDFLFELRDADECPIECCDPTPAPCDGGPSNLCGHEFSEWESIHIGSYAARNTAIARWDVSGGLSKVT